MEIVDNLFILASPEVLVYNPRHQTYLSEGVMRKLILASLLLVALACLTGANIANAGDCGGCKTKCHSCKPKCDPCGESKCHADKPKCNPCGESKCNSCKPKCSPCKPKCNPCGESKCHSCKPKCDPCGESKCHSGCGNPCKQKCGSCGYVDPYANCFTTSSDLSAGGCCGGFGICHQACVTCETVCRRVETCDPCGGTRVDYVYETVYHEIERPTVIPWWFNEKGDGNIYPDMNKGEEKDEAPAESGK
jgi:hypothetical protein